MISLEDFLCRPIAFNRAFVTLTGSINAALMLSQGIYWSKRSSTADGWFYKTQADWEEETGMSRYEQESARKTLRDLGNVWFEDRKGVPAKLFFKVDLAGLLSHFSQHAENPHTDPHRLQETTTPDCGNPASILLDKTTTETTGGVIQFKDRPNSELLVIELLNNIKKQYGIKGNASWTKERGKMIKARLKEWKGEHLHNDIKAMIEHRCRVWKGTEWEKFIRIETLFQPKKFFAYMEEAQAQPDKDWTENKTQFIDPVDQNPEENKFAGLW